MILKSKKQRGKGMRMSDRTATIQYVTGKFTRVYLRQWVLRKLIKTTGGSVQITLPAKLLEEARRRSAKGHCWSPGDFVRIGLSQSGRFVIEWVDDRELQVPDDVMPESIEDLMEQRSKYRERREHADEVGPDYEGPKIYHMSDDGTITKVTKAPRDKGNKNGSKL